MPALLALGVAAAVLVLAQRVEARLALYWALGLGVGIVLQRGRLCFAGAFRDLYLMRNGTMMRAILVGLALLAPIFALIESRAVPEPSFGALAPGAHVVPVGLNLAVGGLLFGIGMVVAGGCVSGTLYRIGEGYLASWASLLGILLGLSLAAHTWNGWYTLTIQSAPIGWLPTSVGYGGAVAVTWLALALAYLGTLWWETRGRDGASVASLRRASAQTSPTVSSTIAMSSSIATSSPVGTSSTVATQLPGAAARGQGASVSAPRDQNLTSQGALAPAFAPNLRARGGPAPFTFAEHLQAMRKSVLGRGWPPLAAVAALAGLNVAAFLVDTPLGVTGELAAWADRAAGLVGLAAPALLGADALAGCNLAIGSGGVINATTLLDGGLVFGALLAALAAHEFKVRVPRQRRRYVQSLAGGSLMGYGAGIAVGCTIGAFFSAIPSLGLSGWVFGVALLVGAGLGTQIIRRIA